VAPAAWSVVLIATWLEPSVSPSSTKLALYCISGIAHFRYRSGKLILAAAEPFGPIADLVFLFDADAWTVSRLVLVFEIVGHRLLDFQTPKLGACLLGAWSLFCSPLRSARRKRHAGSAGRCDQRHSLGDHIGLAAKVS
jgi:hypothetical protein